MRMKILAAAAIVATGCAPSAVTTATAAAAGTPVTGLWQTEGYGMVLSVTEQQAVIRQVTAISCTPLDPAQATGPARPDGSVGYQLGGDGPAFSLSPGDRPDRARLHEDGSTGNIRLTRIAATPPSCGRPQPTGPVGTFDVFWQTFAENYPFFRQKGVDWAAVRRRYRPKVNDKTSDARLFKILSGMIRPLHDAHTGLDSDTRSFRGLRPGTLNTTGELARKVTAFVDRRDLHGTGQNFAGGNITYASLPGGIGYLRVRAFFGYKDGHDFDFAADRVALAKALDKVITGPRAWRGLIIDVRFNPGGFDALGLQLAARLTDRPYLAYAKRARNDPRDPTRFTEPQPIAVRPAAAPRYTGPIALLTSGTTVSAGETFTQALLGRPGRVIRIGQNTQGVFSDIMECALPNGWSLVVPNEEFRTQQGTTFDGPGIPPDIRTPVFTRTEFAQDRDSAFDTAVATLRSS